MIRVMRAWKAYMDAQKKKEDCATNIWDVMKARDLDPMKAFPGAILSRLEDFGRIQERLKHILDDDIFEMTSKHNPYWDSEHEVESDKLDELRRKFACLSDNLWDIWAIAKNNADD